MKKIVIATLAVATLGLAACGEEAKAEGAAAPVAEFTPFVGAERATVADTTEVFVGTDISMGALDLTVSADLEAKTDNRGDVNNINIDGAYALTNDFSVYTENDLNSDFDRTETKVGVKYTF
jgi:hypothetical protein